VVIDEQHRFRRDATRGVARARAQSGRARDDATPIPRSLAMTVYGDLDVSIIDELPPGRTPIETMVLVKISAGSEEIDLARDQSGPPGYVVYPLVEESEKMDSEGRHAPLRVSARHCLSETLSRSSAWKDEAGGKRESDERVCRRRDQDPCIDDGD
jgi:RecG-like helicase